MVTAAPIPRVMPERPFTVPRDLEHLGLPDDVLKVLEITWASLEKEVIVPLLEADDLSVAIQQHWEAYLRWSHVAADTLASGVGIKRALDLAEQTETTLRDLNTTYGEVKLGRPAARAFEAGLDLNRLVRQSVSVMVTGTDLLDTVAAELVKVEPAVAAHGLSALAVWHFFLNPEQRFTNNAATLANWSYHYADMAYTTLGLSQISLKMVSKLEHG